MTRMCSSGILQTISELSDGKHYGDDEETTRAFRIVADHIRCATFILGDRNGVTPSNVDQGYVLRRLIRRAIRFAGTLGIAEGQLSKVAEKVIEQYKARLSRTGGKPRKDPFRAESGGGAVSKRPSSRV